MSAFASSVPVHSPYRPLPKSTSDQKPKMHLKELKTSPKLLGPPPVYKDGLFAQIGISLFRRLMRPSIGWTSPRPGYDGLVEECRMLMARVGPREQQRVVRTVLNAMFFAPTGTHIFRQNFASQPSLNAQITPRFFAWLVGPCENNVPPEGGHGVRIDRCRFLEESGCKGLCVNMCQQPTQSFFTEVLGLPVRMTPDYDDYSCQMTFGIPPLPLSEDPAISGECFTKCNMSGNARQRGDKACYVSESTQ